jgi:hypothetical protein
VASLIEPHLPDAGQWMNAVTVAHSFVVAVLLFAWCKADAAARGITPPAASPVLVAFLAPIGVPYYFIRSMSWRAAGIAILKAVLFLAVVTLLGEVAYYISALA